MKIEKGRRVRLKIRLAVVDGDELEKSVVEYFHGSGTMLEGLESELEGLEKGAKKKGVIDAKHAFGDESRQPKKTIARSEFPEDAVLDKGSQFVAKGADGMNVVLRVLAVNDNMLDVVFLHPLSEKDIEFDAEVLEVTDPSPPPLPASAIAEVVDEEPKSDDDKSDGDKSGDDKSDDD